MKDEKHENGDGVTPRWWLAFIIIATMCMMSAFQLQIEEPLKTITAITIGFYFANRNSPTNGNKNGNGQAPTT